MRTITDIEKLNTIYIISKGRPQCHTARTLTEMNYPGPWFIVCGNNDETLEEYKAKWGADRILVFDWYEQIKHTDVLDNFGFTKHASGAVPVRNAVFELSRQRGERRHWQLDDDYTGFWLTNTELNHNDKMTGEQLYWWCGRIAKFGDDTKMANVGFMLSSSQFPASAKGFNSRVFNAHNMSNEPGVTPEWRGRLNDDVIHAVSVHRLGQMREMQFRFIGITMTLTQKEAGGLTEMYQALGTVRKTAYLMLVAPNASKLTIRFRRFHHEVKWQKLMVKLISEKWKK